MSEYITDILEKVKTKKITKADALKLIRQHKKDEIIHENALQNPKDIVKSLNSTVSESVAVDEIKEEIKNLISEVTKIPLTKMDDEITFEEMGFDSIIITELNKKVENYFGISDSTLFYQYKNIHGLVEYLKEKQLFVDKKYEKKGKQIEEKKIVEKSKISKSINISDDIAIIGVSGRFPQADTIEIFWDNLFQGKDCIEEIPKDRWSLEGFYEPNREKAIRNGLSYSKWGGFLHNIEYFDPLFFNIAPKDAIYMDPQERLLLESAWKCIENAGYTRKKLSEKQVGVFAGASFNNYQLFMAEGANTESNGSYIATSQMFSIANRISYVMNFNGPSLTVDTACSSSLYAVHLACESIQSGQANMAIAGGVNLTLHPSKYVTLCQGQFNAIDGRCRAFCEGGTGYVPAEGVGMVLLKPLSNAMEDHDYIWGTIKGTGISHAGRTNGYTVPSPASQSLAIEKAIIKSGLNPRTISCIEAHGTGTALGDPIEVKGLTDVYERFSDKKEYCSIASVKSNIGHAEAAAGIAQLIKMLLQFKHKTIVKNVQHGNGLNPNINFSNTPFYVQTENKEWIPPLIDGIEYPRRAGISSFGAGGANAHIIVEEYTMDEENNIDYNEKAAIIILSARTDVDLKEHAKLLLNFIRNENISESQLINIAYTLQTGREAMNERLGFVVYNLKELENTIDKYINNETDVKVYRGNVKSNKNMLSILENDEEIDFVLKRWVEKGKYDKLLNLWVTGLPISWEILYSSEIPYKIPLPSYPFKGAPYWIPNNKEKSNICYEHQIHPMIHQNCSNLEKIEFKSTFTGKEIFLKDHIVKEVIVLPGVAYLEMARIASAIALGYKDNNSIITKIKNIVWASPIMVTSSDVKIYTKVKRTEQESIAYEIYSVTSENEKPVIHCQGNVEIILSGLSTNTLDIQSLMSKCGEQIISSESVYSLYKMQGINYGPANQGIECLYIGKSHVLAKISIPNISSLKQGEYVLNPCLLDSVLQATIGLVEEKEINKQTNLPFSMKEIVIYNQMPEKIWALIRYSANNINSKVIKADIDVCDEKGNICVQIKEFSSRVLANNITNCSIESDYEKLILSPSLKEKPIDRQLVRNDSKQIVFLCEPDSPCVDKVLDSNIECISLFTSEKNINKRYEYYCEQILLKLQAIIAQKSSEKIILQIATLACGENKIFSGLFGMLKAAQQENPRFSAQLIEVEDWYDVEKILNDNKNCITDSRIIYKENIRYVYVWEEQAFANKEIKRIWREGGIYLITGGNGRLGASLAKEILSTTSGTQVILTGRSCLKEEDLNMLEEATHSHSFFYYNMDVSEYSNVSSIIEAVLMKYGTINGIIHCAGIIKDNLVTKKTVEETRSVLLPKVTGLVNLDLATKHIPLDFFLVYSSIAGVLGNPGQSDYSSANAFMDEYCEYRNKLVSAGERYGRTIAFNWPLWKDGGMHVDEGVAKIMFNGLGMVPLNTLVGFQILYIGFILNGNRFMTLVGDIDKIRKKILHIEEGGKLADNIKETQVERGSFNVYNVSDDLEKSIIDIISELLQVNSQEIDIQSELSEYGFDSISLTQLANKINDEFKIDITPTVFFEYTTILGVVQYLLEDYNTSISAFFKNNNDSLPVLDDILIEEEIENISQEGITNFIPQENEVSFSTEEYEKKNGTDNIAIVGMSGVFPMASDINQFWENIKNGKNCVSEIPENRWDWRKFYGNPTNEYGKTQIKWGGFIDNVDVFDPLFFEISPKEAETMDPQQRILLMQVWKALEDGGILPELFSQRRTGVFVAAGPGDYANISPINYVTPQAMTGRVTSMIPNRISFVFNLKGPSEYYETACSSTLVAMHRAIQSIQSGECEQAIIAAVNLLLSPDSFIGFDSMGFLSEDGKTKSFQNSANGYVRSEAAGALILKPVSQAIEDSNHIYAVVKGSGIFHGGKSLSLTAPSAVGIKHAVLDAISASKVDPHTIQYIEAHGIGSTMADGIEANALMGAYKEALKGWTVENQEIKPEYKISSLKPCIGHGEVASGLSAIVKTIMAMQHEIIPGIPAFGEINRFIEKNEKFVFSDENVPWRSIYDSQGDILPKRASINSYGVGGVNAHIILEEYIKQELDEGTRTTSSALKQIIVLSAQSKEQLMEYAKQILIYINQKKEFSLKNFAYTLQTGRKTMEYRIAFIANTINDIREGFEKVLGLSISKINIFDNFSADDFNYCIKKDGLYEEEYSEKKIALHWLLKGSYSWKNLYDGEVLIPIQLPTYPFRKNHYRNWSIDCNKNNIFETHERLESQDINDKLLKIISDVTGVEKNELEKNNTFRRYGLDSILRMQLLQKIQSQFNPTITLDDIQECDTPSKLLALVERKAYVAESVPSLVIKDPVSLLIFQQFPELIHLNNIFVGVPIFWFHGGLGGVEMYQEIAQKSRRPFYGIQARGWMTDRMPLQGISAMAAYYIHIIQNVQPTGPYELGGYSLGGVIAYEVTRQLQEMDKEVKTLIMLDTPYGNEFQAGEINEKSSILQAVNLALAMQDFQDPEKFKDILVSREELDLTMNNEALFSDLISIAKTHGLTKTEGQIRKMMQDNMRMQHAYQFEYYSAIPLPSPASVTCYYFRNKEGLIFGDLEYYFSTTEDINKLNRAKYWAEWEIQFKNIHIIDLDVSNHMVLLSESKSLETIKEFCELLYSEKGISDKEYLMFMENTMQLHGVKAKEI